MSSSNAGPPAAGWYPDPQQPGQQRYWDGNAWTEHRAPSAPSEQSGSAAGPAVAGPVKARPGKGCFFALVIAWGCSSSP